MNLQEYISTGILEAYVLGYVTAEERLEVERQLVLEPELQEEMRKVDALLPVAPQPLHIPAHKPLKSRSICILVNSIYS